MSQLGDMVKAKKFHQDMVHLIDMSKIRLKKPEHGPGTELKKLIAWFPIPGAKKKCGRCKSLELKMNNWGCETCENTKKNYIIRKLMVSAKRNGVPTSEFLVGVLLKKAIRNARSRQ